jgi:glutamate dehydrogenase
VIGDKTVTMEAGEIIDKIVRATKGRVPVSFVRDFYAWAEAEDLRERGPERLAESVASHYELSRQRMPGEILIGIGPRSVDVITDDMPFLVDSVVAELNRQSVRIELAAHPVFRIRRDAKGRLLEVLAADSAAGEPESFIHVDVDHPPVEADLRRVLEQVAAVVADWPRMRAEAKRVVEQLGANPPPVDPEEVQEARALLEWMDQGYFTFLGYREYDLVTDGAEDSLRVVKGSGLGLLRDDGTRLVSHSFAALPPDVRRLARAKHVLNLTKANTRSPVHRPSYMDYVGVKRFGTDGEVIGEWRFLGLYTTSAYNIDPRQAPVMGRKVTRVLARAGFPPASHSRKALIDILQTYPRDELLQISEDELFHIATGILHLGERQRLRLFVRRDAYGRYLSCLVYVPRDVYNTEARLKIEAILLRELGGVSVDWDVRLTESVLARVHFVIYTDPAHPRAYNVERLEGQVAQATRSWTEDLQRQLGDERLFARYRQAFPASYRAEFAVDEAAEDIAKLEGLEVEDSFAMRFCRPQGTTGAGGSWRLKVFRSGDEVSLSQFLPMLENLGVRVVDERPYRVETPDRPAWIYDLGLSCGPGELDDPHARELFEEAFAHVWRGKLEDDGFNRLVLRAQLSGRQVVVLRALSRYQRQAGSAFSPGYVEAALASHPAVARLLVELFVGRFDPHGDRREVAKLDERIGVALDAIPSLDDDRILRGLWSLVRATLRTNYFQTENGASKAHVSFKLDPAQIPDLPLPRPMFEIWVYSPRMEGCHLRAGRVARGGIRWSDRREDFRTEVLGLMKAQTVKNTVIVPVGAKGGFIVKQSPSGEREKFQAEVIACYQTLIRGMLDITDNLVGGRVVPPPDVVRYDDDDTYLVVAADKGTATFSDIANALAKEYEFWLGDAFASGGSAGYDHKKMGITSRGAWESVQRHFRELGIDADTAAITVVGIGDMSGDVFGNGMLRSRHMKLIGAFNHQHIFIDPEPDAEAAFGERERLFNLPRSGWSDYDSTLISKGGGVFERSAKSIATSPEMRKAIGIDAKRLAPNELISALLRAPCDLLWNGGIGTYVKASTESHAEVGDKANDGLRVSGRELRCKVVAEGGNLGFTQRGRVEFALRGGKLNTDAIDNSAGVDTSDHEVNIKIALTGPMAAGDLDDEARGRLLAEMTDEIAAHVLRDNFEQVQTLSAMQALAVPMLDTHARLMRAWEQQGRLNRAVEFLPDEEALAERRAKKLGMTRPELAILLAYGKIALYDQVLASSLPDDSYLQAELEAYFPHPLVKRFKDRLHEHPLQRDIIATAVSNAVINRTDPTLTLRLGDETGATASEIAAAHWAAWDAFRLGDLWAQVETLPNSVPAPIQLEMLAELSRLCERSTRWLLQHRRRPLVVGEAVSFFQPRVERVTAEMPKLLSGEDHDGLERSASRYRTAGVPDDLADRVAGLGSAFAALDVAEVTVQSGRTEAEVAAVYFGLGSRLHLHWLRDRIFALPRNERWSSLARAALRDDLYGLQSALTAMVLAHADADAPLDADGLIQAWAKSAGQSLQRCLQVIDDIRAAESWDVAILSVPLRELRSVINSTS